MNFSEYLPVATYPWIVPGIIGLLAVAMALLVHAIALPLLRRVLGFSVLTSIVLEHVAHPTRYLLPLLALQFVWEAYPNDLRYMHSVQLFTAVLLMLVFTWVSIRVVSGIAEAVIRLHPAANANDLQSRRLKTQTRVLSRTVMFFVLIIGFALALMLFPSVRHIGASILASAGVAGIAAGIAARPVLSNLIAGLQIALTQPLRLDDQVVIQGEWGVIEEITATYVVVAIWDQRRLVVPLQWVIENPFQNWTRTGSELLGTVMIWLDYTTPISPMRKELERICANAPEWDHRLAQLQVVDANDRAMQVRCLVSAADAGKIWDLRCRVRKELIDYIQREYPDSLPRIRADLGGAERTDGKGHEY